MLSCKNCRINFQDKILIIFLLVLVLLPFTGNNWLFSQTPWFGASPYAFIAALYLFVEGLIFIAFRTAFFKTNDIHANLLVCKKLLSGVFGYIGLSRVKAKESILSIILGIAVFFAFFVLRYLIEPGTIAPNLFNFPTALYMFGSVIVVPIFEEVTYRGLLINRINGILSNFRITKNKIALISIFISSILFAFIHTSPLPYKFLSGLFLGYVYLSWGKKLTLNIIIHSVFNLLIAFVVII